MVKQHRNYFHSKMIYISLFLWPVFSFITTFYSYRSFEMADSAVSYLTRENLIVYLILGYMCMSFSDPWFSQPGIFPLSGQEGRWN